MATQVALPDALTLEKDGAVRIKRAALSILPALESLAARHPQDRAGVRLHGDPELRALTGPDGVLHSLAASTLGTEARAVRAILFDKTASTNWALGWHQDRTIAVVARHTTSGFRAWSFKSGMFHVEPPFAILEGMLTMRVHLDPVPADNAPLSIVPASHQLGRIPESDIAAIVARFGRATCLAERGDVWLYATPILHASEASAQSAHRRVLQIDYAASDLPGGLEWLGL